MWLDKQYFLSTSQLAPLPFIAPCSAQRQLSLMRLLCPLRRRFQPPIAQCVHRRNLLTLAIETSCDDTSVAVLEKHKDNSATLYFNSKVTSDNRTYKGVHPVIAHESHQQNLAKLVDEALRSLPIQPSATAHIGNALLIRSPRGTEVRKKPDFVTATRGPGMRASLITGIDTAKGLAVAWQVPFLGVNHMQAHALTPRLVSALDAARAGDIGSLNNNGSVDKAGGSVASVEKIGPLGATPAFPFLSLLVSGGHTMLVHSKGLCDHEILAQTTDLAIGDMIDKCARDILPSEILKSARSVMYGPALEHYAFPDASVSINDYGYKPPSQRAKLPTMPTKARKSLEQYDWFVTPSLTAPGPGVTRKDLAAIFSFSGIGSSLKSIITKNPEMDDTERRALAREAMRVAFEHLGSRVMMALQDLSSKGMDVETLVVSGGVASNQYLKHILRAMLDSTGRENMRLVFPPPELCTDNAAMIAWTGIEMWEAGYRTELDAMAMRKWAIDPKSESGGILGISGWKKITSDD
jgi:N6-L-threonylcarbamoyladenine synthase